MAPFTRDLTKTRIQSIDFLRGIVMVLMAIVLVEVVLYFICKRYMTYKAANPDKKWLRYI